MSTTSRAIAVLSLSALLLAAAGCGGGGGYSAPPLLGAPENVTLTAVGRTLEVSWAAVTGADGYNVYVAASSAVCADDYYTLPEGQHIPLAPAGPVSFKQLTPGQTYFAVVAASVGGREGASSSAVSATLPVAAPRGVTVTGRPAAAFVRWDVLLGAASYVVYVAADERLTTENWALLPEGSRTVVSAPELDVPGLTDGRDYWFLVAGVNSEGEGPACARVHGVPTSKGTFPTSTPHDAGAGASALAALDFDKNGIEDLVAVSPTTGSVNFLRGLGGGGFAGPAALTTMTSPTDVAYADLDGDTNPDLVVTDSATNEVMILLGNGLGGTKWVGSAAVGAAPVAVALGGLDGNGLPDIVTVNGGASSVTVLLNQGYSGGLVLSPGTEIPVDAGAAAVAIADVDGNGANDLVVACATAGTVEILYGDGSGSFPTTLSVPSSIPPNEVAVFDTDGDGYKDLVVTSADGRVLVLRGLGGGIYLPAQSPIPASASVASLSAGQDVNGDGFADIIVADEVTGTFVVLLGQPGGVYKDYYTGIVGTDADHVEVADFNGDGILDVAVTSHVDGTVSVFLGSPV